MVFSCCTTSIQGGRDTSHNTISAVKTLLQDVRFKFQIYDKGYNSGGCAFVKTDTQERAWVPGLHVLLLVGVTSAATSHGKRWKGRARSHFLGQLLTKIEMAEMRLQLLRGLPKPNPDPERIAADGDYLKRYLALFYCQFFICFSTCFSLFSSFSFFPTFHLVFPHVFHCFPFFRFFQLLIRFFHMFFLVFQFFVFSNCSFGFSTCFSLFSNFSFFPTVHLVFPHVFPWFFSFSLISNFSFGFSTCFSVFHFFQPFIWFFPLLFQIDI